MCLAPVSLGRPCWSAEASVVLVVALVVLLTRELIAFVFDGQALCSLRSSTDLQTLAAVVVSEVSCGLFLVLRCPHLLPVARLCSVQRRVTAEELRVESFPFVQVRAPRRCLRAADCLTRLANCPVCLGTKLVQGHFRPSLHSVSVANSETAVGKAERPMPGRHFARTVVRALLATTIGEQLWFLRCPWQASTSNLPPRVLLVVARSLASQKGLGEKHLQLKRGLGHC